MSIIIWKGPGWYGRKDGKWIRIRPDRIPSIQAKGVTVNFLVDPPEKWTVVTPPDVAENPDKIFHPGDEVRIMYDAKTQEGTIIEAGAMHHTWIVQAWDKERPELIHENFLHKAGKPEEIKPTESESPSNQ
jgi:hypothetical protein